jgi:uncharacterized phage-associated protein
VTGALRKLSYVGGTVEYMSENRPPVLTSRGTLAKSYSQRMALSAHEVAAVLRDRLPGLRTMKLHKLLYYCQGHHLATFGEPLFNETISAWDMGPVVGQLWHDDKHGEAPTVRAELTEAQLNTVGYVLSRYGALTGTDLANLTHSETPWKLANRDRRRGERVRIELKWIRDYFETSGAPDGEDDEVVLDSAAVTEWLGTASARQDSPTRPDTPEDIQARVGEIRSRLARA